jgi:small subunit ribosomal protein S8
MSMTDPIADMLTRIRNAVQARHRSVAIPGSKMKQKIAEILKTEGYINDFKWATDHRQGVLTVTLKWATNEENAIEGLKRVSRPGQRRYAGSSEIPNVRNGLGIMIISTSKGMMTDRSARKAGIGGELVCSVW